MDRVDEYIFSGNVRSALRISLRSFKFNPSVRTFRSLVRVLTTMRQVRSVRRLLAAYPHFAEGEISAWAFAHFRTMNLRELERILPRLSPALRAWIEAAYGNVPTAMEIVERNGISGFILDYLKILAGERPSLNVPFPHRMSYLYGRYLQGLYLIFSGLVDRGIEVLNDVAHRSIEQGFVGWGIDSLLIAGLTEGDASKVVAGKELARGLGDLLSYQIASIYAGVFGYSDQKIHNFSRINRINAQKLYANSVMAGKKVTYARKWPFGYYALWWYVDKRIHNRPYISFAGRLRIMEGKVERRFPRYDRGRIVLAFHKLLGREGRNYAHLIFPGSTAPERRYDEYLSRLREARGYPMDLAITLRYGTFLSDEGEGWANFLKDRFCQGRAI